MYIDSGPHHLRIDLGRQEAPWILLVVDDMWHQARNAVCGLPDPYGGPPLPGLGERATDVYSITAYWDSLDDWVTGEPLVRALTYIPWVASSSLASVAAVVFAPFPTVLTAEFVRSLRGDKGLLSVAALVDVFEGGDDHKFSETWKLLDAADVDVFARAIFTRGGVENPALRWTRSLPRVLKARLDSNENAFREELTTWWQSLIGSISTAGKQFQTLTKDTAFADGHHPSTIDLLGPAERSNLLNRLYQFDPFRVWRWAGELAERESISDMARARWLAAKAAYTWPDADATVPLAALIGILGGINCWPSQARPPFKLDDSLLETIRQPHQEPGPGYSIDRLNVLGALRLVGGRGHQEFACALRDWLLHPEQFHRERAAVRQVSVSIRGTNVVISIEYTNALPEAITTLPGERRGSARRAYEAVASFATQPHWDASSRTLSLSFPHER